MRRNKMDESNVIDGKLINLHEVLLVEILVKYPKYEQIYGCILITFKNGATTELFNIEGGYPEGFEEVPLKKKELRETMKEYFDSTVDAIQD